MAGFDLGQLAVLAAVLLAAGVVSGLLAGLFGVGGGAVMVPVLYQLFGFIGIFIMPIVITVLKVLNDDGVIHIWRSSKKSVEADAAAVQPEDVSAEEENPETDGEPKE